MDSLSRQGDEGKCKESSLVVLVLFNNQLEEKWLQGKITIEQTQIIKDTCEACGINSIPKINLKKELDTLVGTYVSKQDGIYRTIHDKLFDFLAYYFGKKMIECLIEHGNSLLVRERFIWHPSINDETNYIDFMIKIPDEYLESYFQRFIKDWLAGKVAIVFSNNNLKISSFRQRLIQYLKQLDKLQQVKLANTKDSVLPQKYYGSGNTPLVLTCYHGYIDMIQWLLRNAVDVNQCKDDVGSGLLIASQKGHTDIVKLLLERNPDVNRQNKHGLNPLLQASRCGHTGIVKLLLEKNPDVNLCSKQCFSPLIMASSAGHTDIVSLLLERNPDPCDNTSPSTSYVNTSISKSPSLVHPLMKHKPDINAQTRAGGSALYYSARNGNLEITQILLKNNANCNICIHRKQSIIDTLNIHPTVSLEELKRKLFDSLVESTSSRVTEYVSKKSVEYAFDVVAGSSPLHIACFMGRINVVCWLIDYNANINMTKEDGTTPLFYACEVGHEDIVRLLLDKEADTKICRLDGKSPLKIAIDNKHTSIVVVVTEHIKKEQPLL